MKYDDLDIPILFVAFKRSSLLRYYLSFLSEYRGRIYVFQDRDVDSSSDFVFLRKTLTRLNKENKIKYYCSEENLGVRKGCVAAINWFFTNENDGIIIEDDVKIDSNFLLFVESQKAKILGQRNYSMITSVCKDDSISAAHLTRFTHIWGWYTTAAKWSLYDEQNYIKLDCTLFNPMLKLYLLSVLDYVEHVNNTWDYHWFISNLICENYVIAPPANLSENVGFDSFAHHTMGSLGHHDVIHDLIFPISEFREEVSDRDSKRLFGYNELNGSFDLTLVIRVKIILIKLWELLKF